MSKTVKLKTSDVYSVDDDLDLGGFDFESESGEDFMSDSRAPVTKLRDGVVEGIKDTLTSPTFLKKQIKSTLPSGYGSAMDLADQGIEGIKQLYDNAGKELKPVVKDLKRVTGKMLPMFDGMLPNAWASKLKEWSKEEKSFQQEQIDQKEAAIAASVGQIFGKMEEANQQRDAENRASDALQGEVDKKRFEANFGQLNEVRMGITSLAQYKKNIESQYQRKSLELQFRSYYALADILTEMKDFNGNAKEKLSGILRNTGLPEIVKTQNSEYLQDIMKNDFIGGMYDGIFGGRRDFFQNLSKGLVKRATDGVKTFKESFVSGLSAAEMSADQIQMMKESGMLDPYSMGGNMAGAGLAERFGDWSAKKARGLLAKNEKVKNVGDRLAYEAGGFQGTINDWADGYKHEGGMLGWITSPIKEEIRRLRGREQTAQLMQGDVLNEPGMFTRRTDKSINEVIPGFLARILQEQTRTRLGREDVDLVVYDYNAGKFSSHKGISQSLGKMFDKKYINNNINRDVNEMLSLIDPTGEKLTPDQRKLIGQTLLKANIAGQKLTKESLTDSYNYRGGKRGDADQISNVMQEYLGSGMDYGKLNQLQDRYHRIGTGNRIDYKKIQDLIHLGYGDQLMEMGIIDEKGRIRERDLLLDAYMTGDKSESFSPYANESPAAKGAVKRSKRVLGRGGPTTTQSGRSGGGDVLQFDESVFQPTNSILEKILAANTEALTFVKGVSGNGGGSDYQGKVTSGIEQIREILTGIHEQLLSGIRFAGFGDGELTTGGKSQWYNKTIGQLFKGARKRASAWKDKAGEKLGKFKDWGLGKGGEAKSWFQSKMPGWKEKTTGWWNKGKAKFDNIYIEVSGKIKLALDKVKLEQGDYWDVNTNTKITKFSDITGAVEDRSKDPPEIVLTEEQAKEAFIMVGKGRKLLSKLTKFKDWVKNKFGLGQHKGRVLLRLGRMAMKKLWRRATDEPIDIYTPDNMATPLLYASLMRSGAYISKYKGHLVDRPSKIDGPVLNRFKDNEEVVNEDQFKLGLVTIDGKPIKTGVAKLWQRTKDLATAGMGQIKKLWGTLRATGGKLLGKGWDRFSNWAKDANILNPGSVMVVNRLDKIIQLLDTRLPGGKKRKLGDLDGDGIVENSFEDIVAKRKAQAKEKLAGLQDKAKGGLDALKGSSLLAGIASFFKKKDAGKEETEDEEEDDGSLLDGASDLKDSWDMANDAKDWTKDKFRNGKRRLGRMFGRKGAKDVASKAAKKGLLRRGVSGGGRMAGRALGGTGRVLGSAANLASRAIASPVGAIGRGILGVAGSGAVTSALGGAVSLLGSGAAAAGSMAMGAVTGLGAMAGGIASGIGALMSAPVLLGAAAIGATAYGAYKGYKYLTRNKMNTLEELRYAQYGFDPSDNQYWSKIGQLEEEIYKNTRFDDASPSVDEKNLKVQAIAEDFGVDLENQQQVVNFIQWYRMRFKPVFMQHLMAWKRSGTKSEFTNLGDMEATEKQKYLSFAKFPNGPYGVTLSPFPELAQLTAGKAVVDAAAKKAQDEVDAELKTKKPETAKVAGAAAGAAVGAAAVKVAAGTATTPAPQKPAKTLAEQLEQQAGKGVGDYSKINDQGNKVAGAVMPIVGSYVPMAGSGNGKVDALSAIRFKTYGLKELEVAKIRALSTLENGMLGNFRYNAKKVAEWTGSTQEMVNRFAPAFGIDVMDPIESGMWARWFAGRFLPVYLNFASCLFAATGKTDPILAMNGTTGAQNYDAAMAIIGSNNRDGVPVWSVTFTPWRNYPLNTKSSSTDEHVAVLKAAQGDKIANAERGKLSEDDKQLNNTASQVGAGVENKDRSLLDSIKDNTSSLWAGVKNSTFGKAVGDAVDWAKNTEVGKGISEATDWATDKAGQVIDFVTGSGGTYASIPQPTGNGSLSAHRQMIETVSKIVGVDPKLMLSIAAIESAFDKNAKNKVSSAEGLYQFVDKTWIGMLKQYGAKYGLPKNVSRTDPVANALMGAEFIRENARSLKSVRPQLTDTDLYLAHFMGAVGAKKFLRLAPGDDAVRAMPKEAASNKDIFFEGKGGRGRSRTAAEVYAELNRRVRTRAAQVGLETGGKPAPTQTAAAAPAKTPTPPTVPAPKSSLVATAPSAPAPSAAAAKDASQAKKTTPVNVVTPATAAPAPVTPPPQSSATQNAGLDMGMTNDILSKSYQTQQGMLKVLMEIKDAINQRTPENTRRGAAMPVNEQTTSKVSKQTAPLGKIPVDPIRTIFGS